MPEISVPSWPTPLSPVSQALRTTRWVVLRLVRDAIEVIGNRSPFPSSRNELVILLGLKLPWVAMWRTR